MRDQEAKRGDARSALIHALWLVEEGNYTEAQICAFCAGMHLVGLADRERALALLAEMKAKAEELERAKVED